jgi:hypothetical protein
MTPYHFKEKEMNELDESLESKLDELLESISAVLEVTYDMIDEMDASEEEKNRLKEQCVEFREQREELVRKKNENKVYM